MCDPTSHNQTKSNGIDASDEASDSSIQERLQDLNSQDATRQHVAIHAFTDLAANPDIPGSVVSAILPALVQVLRRNHDQKILTGICEVLMFLAQSEANRCRLVEAGTLKAVLEVLEQEDVNTQVAEACCKFLHNMSFASGVLQRTHYGLIITAVLQTMRRYPTNDSLQEIACGVIGCACHKGRPEEHNGPNRVLVKESGGIDAIMDAMKRHAAHEGLLHSAILALVQLAYEDTGAVPVAITEAGGIEEVVEAMRSNPKVEKIQTAGCGFLTMIAFCKDKETESILQASGAVQVVLKAMATFPTDPDLQQYGCGALWNVSALPSFKILMGTERGVIQSVINAMRNHPDHAVVQEKAMGALWDFSAKHDEVRVNIVEAGGIDLVTNAMEAHGDNSFVEKLGSGILCFLSESSDIRVKLALVESKATLALRCVVLKYDKTLLSRVVDSESFRFSQNIREGLSRLVILEEAMVGGDPIFRFGVAPNFPPFQQAPPHHAQFHQDLSLVARSPDGGPGEAAPLVGGGKLSIVSESTQATKRRKTKTPQEARRSRKNEQSRLRAARLREQIAQIKKKAPGGLTLEERQQLTAFEDRRQIKNDRCRERAAAKKQEMERIMAKPERKRTRKENKSLLAYLTAREHKNEGDRIRRNRMQDMKLQEAGVTIMASSLAHPPFIPEIPTSPLPTLRHAHFQSPGTFGPSAWSAGASLASPGISALSGVGTTEQGTELPFMRHPPPAYDQGTTPPARNITSGEAPFEGEACRLGLEDETRSGEHAGAAPENF